MTEGDAFDHDGGPAAFPAGTKDGARDRRVPCARRSAARQEPLFSFSNLRSMALPRSTIESSACWAVLLPAHPASSSSLKRSRICTKLPHRRPFKVAVGGRSEERSVGQECVSKVKYRCAP